MQDAHFTHFTPLKIKARLKFEGDLYSKYHGSNTSRYYSAESRYSVWLTDGLEFESWKGQDISLLHVVYTYFAANPASFPMGIRGLFTLGRGWIKVAGARSRLLTYK
jgi:hypothetical protein